MAEGSRTVRSYCRICAAACGILVTVEPDDTVSRVRGDPDHPASQGYVCSKGRGLAAWHHRPDRLDHPRLRGERATWDAVLGDLGGALSSIRAAHSADAVGMYLATGFAYDAAGQVAAGTWMAAVGSRAFYTAVTVDNAPILVVADLVGGHPMLDPVWDPSAGGLLVLVGTNPVVSHGYGTTLPDPIRHLRRHRAAGGRTWVVDPRRTESAAQADEHLPVRPGSDVALLAALARRVLADVDARAHPVRCSPADLDALRAVLAPWDDARAADAAGIDEAQVHRLAEEVVAARGRLAMMCGTGTTMARDGVLVEWLRWVLLVLTDSLDRPGAMVFQDGPFGRLRPSGPASTGGGDSDGPRSRPDLPRVVGQLPVAALVDEIERGELRALVVTGGNPLTAFPEPERVRDALGRLDVLATIDVVDGELCGLATHVLPATGQLERADLTMSSALSVRSAVLATAPVVPARAERRPAWWILAQLARRMDLDLIGGADPSAIDDETYLRGLLTRAPIDGDALFAAGSHGVDVPVEHGWVVDALLPDGVWRVAPAVLVERLAAHEPPDDATGPVLVPRREMGWSNSVRYGGGEVAVVRLHPDDARAAGLGDGDRAEVASAHGAMETTVAVDDGVRPGVVSVTHGHDDASPGRLTSRTVGVDPLTAMPHASGLPVTVRRPAS